MKPLMADQGCAIEHLREWKAGALFMQPGAGKTRAALEIINATPCSKVVWVGPLRTIRAPEGVASVEDEIAKWGGFKVPAVYYGVESIQASDRIYGELMSEFVPGCYLVVDESLKIKNCDAKRTKRLLELSRMAEYRLILNGTPMSRDLLDLYPQMNFLSPKILNMSLAQFKNTFCRYTKITKSFGGRKNYSKEFITGYENVDYLYSLIRHYVYECDLKLNITQNYHDIGYHVDDESREQYEYIKKTYLEDEMLEWKNSNIFLEMTQKMQHGYCLTEDKFAKLDVLFKKVPQDKTIIYCKYVASREECSRRYPDAMVLSYAKESLGLNLQDYIHTVYFDKIWDYALRMQAGRRTYRVGQDFDCHYYDLTGDVKLEGLIDRNIAKKIGMTEYFKGKTINEIKKEI